MSRYQPVGTLGHLDNQTAAISGAGYWRGVRLANVGHRCFFAGVVYLTAAAFTAGGLAVMEVLIGDSPVNTGFVELFSWVLFVMLAALIKDEFEDDFSPWLTVRPLLDPKTGEPFLAPVTTVRHAARVVCHALDAFFLIGLVVMARSPYRQSIADKITGTIVVPKVIDGRPTKVVDAPGVRDTF